jgi:transposase-like protein
MTAPKLSDAEKQQILAQYRQTSETSSTLAGRYGVSTSTISRILKSGIPADEYETLIQQKRATRSGEDAQPLDAVLPIVNEPEAQQLEIEDGIGEQPDQPHHGDEENFQDEIDGVLEATDDRPEITHPPEGVPVSATVTPKLKTTAPILRRRSNSLPEGISEAEAERSPLKPLDRTAQDIEIGSAKPGQQPSEDLILNPTEAEALQELLDEDLLNTDDEDLSDLDDGLDDGLDEDDEDDEDEDSADTVLLVNNRFRDGSVIQVLPFTEAPIPRICYLVVDRSAELITRPLKEFGDLGQIPDEEIQEKTLPVFDNHRVAKRYSNPRTQRVIKLPDGRVLQKASSHLRAKGITLLLIDGQVYSLKE